jgi:hypothetical protein
MPYDGHKKTAAKPQVLNAFEPQKKDAGEQRRQSLLIGNVFANKKATS